MRFLHPLGTLTWSASGAWNLNSALSALPTERNGTPLRARKILFAISGTVEAAAGGAGLTAGDYAAILGAIRLKDRSGSQRVDTHGVVLREIAAHSLGGGAGQTALDSAAVAAAAGATVGVQRLMIDFCPPMLDNPEDLAIPAARLRGGSLSGTFNPAAAFRHANDTITDATVYVSVELETYPTAPDGAVKFRPGLDWTLIEEHVDTTVTSVPIAPGGLVAVMLVRHNQTTRGVALIALAAGDLDTVNLKTDGDLVLEDATDEELLALFDSRYARDGQGAGSIDGGDVVYSLPVLWPPPKARVRDFLEGNHALKISGDGGVNTWVVLRYELQTAASAARAKSQAAPGSSATARAAEGDPRLSSRIGPNFSITAVKGT